MESGTRLGPYEIEERLGAGGMGEVYLAQDIRLGRRVAIKVLPADYAGDTERRARFEQEARAAAALNHPNIATLHDVGEESGVSFIVMEVVKGQSLRALVKDGPVPVERALEIARGVAQGLADAHVHGVLHRDLKPDNIVLTPDGEPKILDFGLGKLVQESSIPDPAAATREVTAADGYPPDGSPQVTREGEVMGTLAYMAPEQLLGQAVDARADIFAFGVTLYEMLAGGRPFGGESKLETMAAILRDEPLAIEAARPDVPDGLRRVIDRCLAKKPADRYASGQQLSAALEELAAHRRPAAPRSRTTVLAGSLVLLAVLAAAVGWLGLRMRDTTRARNELLPEAERLVQAGDQDQAMRLLREAADLVPEDARLHQLMTSLSPPLSIDSDPPGADVYVKGYTAVDRPWIHLGTTPLQGVRAADPSRYRLELDGYIPFEGGLYASNELRFPLLAEGEGPPGMVRIPAGAATFGAVGPVSLPAFWIDRYEVTNRQYKEFVDDGGYRRRGLWPEMFASGSAELSWEEARAEFVDTTGRPGPAGWALGTFVEGTAEHPVSGISWYEATAYARWADKSLPTVFHWHRAAQQGIWSGILVLSNFSGEGPAPVGSYDGVGPHGTYDMAGNVGEWCLNAADTRHYVLGGAWSEPSYRYHDTTSAAEPMERSERFGMRLIRTDEPVSATAAGPVPNPVYDFRQEAPIDDTAFDIVRGMYAYDPAPLDARVEETRDLYEHWREEVITVRAAYGDERVPVHLYLPKNAEPPYQPVIYMPGSDARLVSSSANLRLAYADFIPRSGRALVYPVYKGTYERRVNSSGENDLRDLYIQISKDMRRAIDYLETRDDIDADRLGYFGLSWGSTYGPLHTAIDDRFAASVLLAGGLYRYPPERPAAALPVNFAPRSTVPTLMINARDDFGIPIDTNARALLEFLGAPDERKRLVVIDGGHVPESPNLFIREALDWYDRYLGPVEGR